jgi:GTPase SAR1 family protein
VIFVYDIANSETFDALGHWTEEAKLFAPEDIVSFLVANKV